MMGEGSQFLLEFKILKTVHPSFFYTRFLYVAVRPIPAVIGQEAGTA